MSNSLTKVEPRNESIWTQVTLVARGIDKNK